MAERRVSNYHRWLLEVTSLPTAAGCEHRVVEWLSKWVKQRRNIEMIQDRYGNLTIQRKKNSTKSVPVYLTAHLDHPAFVIVRVTDQREVIAEFRGGVHDAYFVNTHVRWRGDVTNATGKNKSGKVVSCAPDARGKVIELIKKHDGSKDKQVRIRFSKNIDAHVGDVITWDLAASSIKRSKLHAPVCDDLAALVAALAAYDELLRSKKAHNAKLLLTRCEEVGFIGAIGACKAKTIPKNALVVALENSKSFPESPIGGGPIVRVGDRISTFHSGLTGEIAEVAKTLEKQDKTFNWQRKLMPGGACEATAYQAYGHIATCVCLPLGNYHNMNELKGKIDHEIISMKDFDNLVKLLVAIGLNVKKSGKNGSLKMKLNKLFDSRKKLVS